MLIDSHSHLDRYLYKEFGSDISPILQQIEEFKILTISNSMDFTSYKANCRIAKKSKYVVPAFGVHPWNAYRYVDRAWVIQKLIEKAIVVGEIGLDYHYVKDRSKYPAQRKIFNLFLQKSKDKFVSVHTKGAENDVLNLLRAHRNEKVIIHWFSGDLDVLEEMIREGYYFSITPEVRFSDHIRNIVKTIPLEQLLTETDNPGGPANYIGEMGMPILIKAVLEEVAKIKGASFEQVEKTVEKNLARLAEPCADNIFSGII